MVGRVSVVIAAFNAARFIGACVDSLRNQTVDPHEIIVVDDASTDNTSSIAAAHGATVMRLERNSGAGFARAHGAAKSSSEVIAFIDSDCIAPKDWLSRILEEFGSDESLGAIGGRYDHSKSGSIVAALALAEEEYAHRLMALSPYESNPPAGNSAFRRSVWQSARSGHETYLFRGINSGEDEFVFNEVRQSARVKYVDSLSVVHQARDTGGYFRRHVNRGRSLGLRLAKKMLADTKGGIRGYGGFPLFAASLLIPVALIALVAGIFSPAAFAIAGIATLVAFWGSRRFDRFLAERDFSPRERLGILCLLPLRSACWAWGFALHLGHSVIARLRKAWNVGASIAHFWMPGRISKLFFFITSACNARCAFCFNLENVENWKARKPVELTLEEIQTIARNFGRLPYLNLSGGEPFMRPDLADAIEAFHDLARTQWVTIPTNASLTRKVTETTQEILTRCPGLFLTIQVSLDGMETSHDESRKIAGGFRAMAATLRELSRLRRWYPNLRIQIATAYDDFNLNQMQEMIDFCRSNFDYDQQIFYLIRETGQLVTQSKNHLVQPFFDLLVKNEDYEWRHHRKTLWSRAVRALQSVTYKDIMQIRREGKFLRPCHATRKFVTLYDDGQVSPCEVLEPVKLGNLRDYSLDYYELRRSEKAAGFYRKDIVEKKCNCDWMCATPINMLYDPSIAPRVVKSVLRPDRLA